MIPLALLPWGKLAAAGAVVVVLAGTHWKAYTVGRNGEQAKAVALQLKQTTDLANFNETQRFKERGWQAQTTKAQNDRAIKNEAAQPLLRSVGSELVSLRSDIYALDTNASGQPVSSCKTAAITARVVFEQCAQRLASVAKAADAHALDAETLENAWPK